MTSEIYQLVAKLQDLGCAVVIARPDELSDLITKNEITSLLNQEKERILFERNQSKNEVWWSGQHY